MAAFFFLLLMMSHGVEGRRDGNVFRLLVYTKTFLTELAWIKAAALVCQQFLSKKPSSSVMAELSSVCHMAVFLSSYSAPH